MEFVDQKALSLLKVAETGSFTRASKELCLSQPAISNQIKIEEEAFGFKIFERTPSGVRTTKKGSMVIKYLSRMNSIANELKNAISEEILNLKSLSLGITHTVESSIVVEAIAKYIKKNNSGMTIRITSDTSASLYNRLNNHELDFVILEGRCNDVEHNCVLLGTDSLVLVTSSESELASRSTLTLDELKRENLIMRLPDSNTMQIFKQVLKQNNCSLEDFNVSMEIDNIATIKDLVWRNFGVSVLAKSVCMDEVRKGKLAVLNIEGISMVREINLVYPKNFEYTDIIQGIVRCYNEL